MLFNKLMFQNNQFELSRHIIPFYNVFEDKLRVFSLIFNIKRKNRCKSIYILFNIIIDPS